MTRIESADDAFSAHDDRSLTLDELRRVSATINEQLAYESEGYTVRLITLGSDLYPARLRTCSSPPPFLWAMGNLQLLSRRSFSLCGSRAASDRGIRWAREFGSMVAHEGAGIVTGLARGVDRAATEAAIDGGGVAIGVLAEGIGSWNPNRFNSAIIEDRLLVLSEFRPTSQWSAGQAMQRNRTICSLGAAMFVIEAGTKGGTLAAGRTALKMNVPLYAIRSPKRVEGNEILVDEGAIPLSTRRELRSALLGAPSVG